MTALEPCMHCGENILPILRGLNDRAVCTPCGVERLGFFVFATRVGGQAGERVLKEKHDRHKS